ncbi:MAG: LlsX family protein [Olsenella sp.]
MSKISHKLKNSLSARLVSYVIGGFAITGVIFFALISVGYASVSSTQAPSYMVTCFGLPIYEITSSSNGPVGQAVGANMSIIGMACTLGMGLVVELVLAARAKDK